MNKVKHWFKWHYLYTILLGIVGLWLWNWSLAPAPKPQTSHHDSSPTNWGKQLDITRYNNEGKLLYQLNIDRAQQDAFSTTVALQGVELKIGEPKSNVQWQATAIKATLTETSNQLDLAGDVHFSSEDGELVLTTPVARITGNSPILESSAGVKLKVFDNQFNAQFIRVDLANQHFLLQKNVRGQHNISQ